MDRQDESTAARPKLVVYIVHGKDEYGIGRFEDQLVALMGDPGLAELNITRLMAAATRKKS